MSEDDRRARCGWCGTDPLYRSYHDAEWGVPLHDERRLFEFLVLEGVQAGLSWLTVLRKRAAYRRAYAGFDPRIVARFTDDDQARLMSDAGLIRNRMKIRASIVNAQRFLEVQAEFGSFADYLWAFVDGRPRINHWSDPAQVPADTAQSRALSKDLKKRGFGFVGPTICYALMQATGLVNDHLVGCFRHAELSAANPQIGGPKD